MIKGILAVALFLSFSATASAQMHPVRKSGLVNSPLIGVEAGKLRGHVVDEEEQVAINKAYVVIYSEAAESARMVRADAQGNYEVDLTPGYYDILVGAVEFMPSCKRIEILARREVEFSPKLRADSGNLQQSSAH